MPSMPTTGLAGPPNGIEPFGVPWRIGRDGTTMMSQVGTEAATEAGTVPAEGGFGVQVTPEGWLVIWYLLANLTVAYRVNKRGGLTGEWADYTP